jgi:hypothetical protein
MHRKSLAPALLLFVLLTVQVVHAQPQQVSQTPCTPGISFWSLLDSVEVGYVDGRLNIGKLYAVCLPAPAKQSSSSYEYDPDAGGKLTTVIKSADGKVLGTYVWYGHNISSLWELSSYKVLGGYQSLKPLAVGNYSLEFAVNDEPFYRFPFSLAEGRNDDPYQPAGARYFIDGPWNEYGNIFYQRNDPESVLKFTTWLQGKSDKDGRPMTSYELKLVNSKTGNLVAEDSGSFLLKPSWQKADLLLHPAGGDKNSYLKAGELLRTDGRYAFRLTVDGKPYGVYPFEVKQGRIQFQGKQIREKTDPMIMIVDYLSGGRYSSGWIKRE